LGSGVLPPQRRGAGRVVNVDSVVVLDFETAEGVSAAGRGCAREGGGGTIWRGKEGGGGRGAFCRGPSSFGRGR